MRGVCTADYIPVESSVEDSKRALSITHTSAQDQFIKDQRIALLYINYPLSVCVPVYTLYFHVETNPAFEEPVGEALHVFLHRLAGHPVTCDLSVCRERHGKC